MYSLGECDVARPRTSIWEPLVPGASHGVRIKSELLASTYRALRNLAFISDLFPMFVPLLALLTVFQQAGLSVPKTSQGHSHHRAFARAVPSAWSTSALDVCVDDSFCS